PAAAAASTASTASAPTAPVNETGEPVQAPEPMQAPAPVAAPVVAASPAPVPAPAPMRAPVAAAPAAEPQGMPRVQAYSLSVDELQAVAAASGLQWVNSAAEKVAQAQAAIAAEPAPIHVPREPKPPVAIDEGPLVLVETRKDLRDLNLPFEQQN